MSRIKALLLVIVFCSGCVSKEIPIPNLDERALIEGAERRSILEALRLSADDVKSFRSLAQVHASKTVGSDDVTQVVVFQRPDRLRVEFFEPRLTQLLMLIIVHGGEIRGIDKNEKRGFFGSAHRENIAKLLSVPLDPEAVMLWFIGRFVPPDHEAGAIRLYRGAHGRLSLRVQGIDGRDTYVEYRSAADSTSYFVDRLVIAKHDGDQVLVDSSFHYPLAETVTMLPERISVRLPTQDTKIELTYDKPVVNPSSIREQLFNLPALDGLEVTDLDAPLARSAD